VLLVLGPVEACAAGGAVALGARKQRAVLARLLLEEGRFVQVERLIDDLWPDGIPASARHAVQVYIHGLRQALARLGAGGLQIKGSGASYALELGETTVDLHRFKLELAEARAQLADGAPGKAAQLLRSGLALWRGDAFADLRGLPAIRAEADRLGELRLQAVELRVDADIRGGHERDVVGELETLVSAHPTRERFRELLMLALYRCGRQAEALEAYRSSRDFLSSTYGIEPSRSMQELQRAILRRELSLEPEATAGASRPGWRSLSSFVGRATEVYELRELLLRRDVRLVTLVGLGGVGKTRLAERVAEAMARDYPDGVVTVELASVRDPVLVMASVAAAFAESGDVATQIGDQRLLLVLDNFEHVLAAGPKIVDLLRRCPHLDVLATSRERLRLSGEHVFTIDPLPLPEACILFVERARAVNRDFPDNGNVTSLCKTLDGLPLAIELAAARADKLSIHEIEVGLTRRLPFLVDGPLDASDRHQTLGATLEWSFDLLKDEQQHLFALVSVFAGGFDFAATRAVTNVQQSAAVDVLVEKSLLRQYDGRYSMLETVREFAAGHLSKLPDSEQAAVRHAEYYSELASHLQPRVRLGDAEAWRTATVEFDNFIAAIARTIETDNPRPAFSLIFSLAYFLTTSGLAGESQHLAARALRRARSSPRAERLPLLIGASEIYAHSGAAPEAIELKLEAIEAARQLDRPEAVAALLSDLGNLFVHAGDIARARAVSGEALALRRKAGNAGGIGHALLTAGTIELTAGEPEAALEIFTRALPLFAEAGSHGDVAHAELMIARCSRRLNNTSEASTRLRAALRTFTDLGQDGLSYEVAAEIAGVLADTGEAKRAAILLGALETHATRLRNSELNEELARTAEKLNHSLPPADLARLRLEGASLEDVDDALTAVGAGLDAVLFE
jgi:predicted ATPase